MKKLFVVILTGTMASGKTTLAKGFEKAFENLNVKETKLHAIKEKNYYLKGEYLSELKLQQNLMSNFTEGYREIVAKIQDNYEVSNHVILLDTFPLVIGEIFTRLKIKYGLIDIKREFYNTFLITIENCIKEFKEINDDLLLDSEFNEINVINVFRDASIGIQCKHMEARSTKEFIFYSENKDYFDELCWELKSSFSKTQAKILKYYNKDFCIHDTIFQDIGSLTDMDQMNQETLELIMKKVFPINFVDDETL